MAVSQTLPRSAAARAQLLRTLVLLRLLAGTALLLAVFLPQLAEAWTAVGESAEGAGALPGHDSGVEASRLLLTVSAAIVLSALALDVVFAFALRFPAGRGRAATALQIWTDVAWIAALTYTTHGPDASPFTVLLFGPVLAASLCWSLPAGLVTAAIAGGCVAAADGIYVQASLAGAPLPLLGTPAPGALLWSTARAGNLTVLALGFVGVSVLGGTLAARLSRVHLLLDEVVQNLGEGVLAVDALGRVAFVNGEASRLLGLPPGRRLGGRPMAELLVGAGIAPVRHLLQAGAGGPTEVDLAVGDDAVPVEVTVHPVLDDAGRGRGTVVTLRDVSLRREVVRARAQAARSDEVREMAAGLAHEIRNPLASVRGAIQELLEGVSATTEVRRLMQLAINESDRLDGIISQFLEFAGTPAPRPERVPARPVLEDVALLLRTRHAGAPLTVVVEAAEPCILRADPGQVRQVLLNLGLNACEAMPKGGTVTLAARPLRRAGPGGPAVLLEVRDTGHGISEADLPKLGTPFFSTKTRGTGLGLAIVHRIIAAHGGTVRIESVPQAGTTVTCTLPGEVSA